MESFSPFTIFVHFRILFSTFRLFLYFFILIFFLISHRFHSDSEQKGEKDWEIPKTLCHYYLFEMCFFSFLAHFSPQDFSFGVFIFLAAHWRFSQQQKMNQTCAVHSIGWIEWEKSLSLRWYVEWPDKIVSFISIIDQSISWSPTMVNDAYMNVART